jgi:hypothetical protein
MLLFDPTPFLGGDNYWYMLLAESLRNGEGYRDLWLPAMPAHTRYPPVYPAALALLGLIANSPFLFKLLSVAFTTGVAALVVLLVERRGGDRQTALLAGLLAAGAPILVEYSHWVLSEPPFTFFSLLAIYGFTRVLEAEGDDRGAWLFFVAVGAALLASLTRSAGYPLILAVLIALGVRRRWRQGAIFLAAVAVVLGSWWLRNKLSVSGDLAYSEWMLFRDPYRPELGTVTVGELVARFAFNFKAYTLAVLPQSLGGRDMSAGAAGLYGVLLAIPILIGAFRRIRELRVTEVFFVLYMGLILLWPEAWSDQRLLLPVLPVAIVLMMEGLAWIGDRLNELRKGEKTTLPAFVAGVAVVGVALFGNVRIMGGALACARQYWDGNRYACYPAASVDFIRAASWARGGTPADAVVVNRKPQIFYWYGRRRGDNYPYTTDADSVMNFINAQGATYVVLDRLSGTTARYLVPAIQKYRNRFGLAHQEGDPERSTYVLTYRREDAQ